MAYYLNNTRYVKDTKPDGTIEHREIKEYYMDSIDDVQDLPGRDEIDECSRAVIMNDTSDPQGTWKGHQGSTYILMTDGWTFIGLDQNYHMGRGR